jgi:hypothetical protein
VGASSTAIINGNVTGCNNTPVTDGYVIFKYGYRNYRAAVNPDGTFSLSTIICSSNINVDIIAIDNATMQQSTILTHSLVSGLNNLGTLNACGTSIEEFINYSINGTNYSVIAPAGNLYGAVNPQNSQLGVYIQGVSDSSGTGGNNIAMIIDATGIAVNSAQNLSHFSTRQINDSTIITTPISVNITEYGTIGQFIAGNFTGTVTGGPPTNKPYNITCNFRVKRSQ